VQYTIRHVTKFTYETPISESVMEVRMQPRSEGAQRCIHFGLSTTPSSRVKMYQDSEGNIVHHFNIPGRHSRLIVTAESLVDCAAFPELPAKLAANAWDRLDVLAASGEYWELLNPSPFTRPTPLLEQLTRDIGLERGDDPLSTLRQLMAEMYARFDYIPRSTRVDSPIDDALEARCGVCQDFAHISIALIRHLGVPCRYVSGYISGEADEVRSSADATHAWVEALLPEIGWVGFDPTNNLVAGDRHIRVAIGRDYADVPPTRGVYKGMSAVRSELGVAVSVGTTAVGPSSDTMSFVPWMSREASAPLSESDSVLQQQQQQQLLLQQQQQQQ
jgi:transglutaminase-like putative cysteine protease